MSEKPDHTMISLKGETPVNDANRDVNYILEQIGGTFGRFQIRNFILYSIALIFCGMAGMSYVFTAMNLEYRFVIKSFISYIKWLNN